MSAFTKISRAAITALIPKLGGKGHKGQSGRIGVVGGSYEYSGAPYLAAMSTLRIGCDLSYIFCAPDVAVAVKSYAPDLIVFPFLKEGSDLMVQDITKAMERSHGYITGPGIGRHLFIAEMLCTLWTKVPEGNPLIIDAGALWALSEHPNALDDVKCVVVLTPNHHEFQRLCKNKGIDLAEGWDETDEKKAEMAKQLVKKYNKKDLYIVCKGEKDIITNGDQAVLCDTEGGPRRSGGQGDVLAGALGTFMVWARVKNQKSSTIPSEDAFAALYAACDLVRRTSNEVFNTRHRGVVAHDLVDALDGVFEKIYPSKEFM